MKAGAAIQAPVEVVELVPGPAHWRIVTDRGSLTATWPLRPTPIRAACRRANASTADLCASNPRPLWPCFCVFTRG
jgi:hypothetical protein